MVAVTVIPCPRIRYVCRWATVLPSFRTDAERRVRYQGRVAFYFTKHPRVCLVDVLKDSKMQFGR